MSNSFGRLFIITSFGESHGELIGVIIDGCPAGLAITDQDIQSQLDRRKPGASRLTTKRKEDDRVGVLSGILNGYTTGAPICLVVWNRDVAPSDYEKIKFLVRPGHADYSAYIKYGGFNDYRGGGRFSGRITAGFVMAGAIARKLLDLIGVEVLAHTVEIGGIIAQPKGYEEIKVNVITNPVNCADPEAAEKMITAIEKAKEDDDSLGGIIEGIALGLPVGLGEPVFGNLDGELAKALFAIPAVKGVEFGSGFEGARKRGSQNNDQFTVDNEKVAVKSNNAGGVLGGMSNGMPLVVRVAVKPTASISKSQQTINIKEMTNTSLTVKGRHDVCIIPRAGVVVESMMAVTLCDFALRVGLISMVIK